LLRTKTSQFGASTLGCPSQPTRWHSLQLQGVQRDRMTEHRVWKIGRLTLLSEHGDGRKYSTQCRMVAPEGMQDAMKCAHSECPWEQRTHNQDFTVWGEYAEVPRHPSVMNDRPPHLMPTVYSIDSLCLSCGDLWGTAARPPGCAVSDGADGCVGGTEARPAGSPVGRHWWSP